jgi:TolB-like protein/class 3 adenylate cyclase
MERRLAAILAADVVGYSRLMGEDEAGTLDALKALRKELVAPEIERHKGRVVKLMGDGLLAEFGSVVEAVACAAAIQSAMPERNADRAPERKVQLRIGINLGDVIVEGRDIYGDGVNVAARLEALADPGGICISATAHATVDGKLDLAFEDIGEQHVKNIAKPIGVYRLVGGGASQARQSTLRDPPPRPDKPSIAVLPFNNMSGGPDQEYFSDGITEDIITELSRFERLFVIARNTVFTYKNEKIDVPHVARELGVHFVLEGSVRKSGDRVRISAQLIDGLSGSHVWAERYDGNLEDVFDLQEDVTRQVVASVAPKIDEAEMDRVLQGTRRYDEAYDLAWRADARFRLGLSAADLATMDESMDLARQALALNSKCSIAYRTLCWSYAMYNLFSWGDDPLGAADRSLEVAEAAMSAMPQSFTAYSCLGLARSRKGQYEQAVRDLQRANELNPNDAFALQTLSWCEASLGETQAARKHALEALRLSPKDYYAGLSYLALAMAAFVERDHADFVDWARKAIQAHPVAPIRRAMMIAYAAEIGDQELLDTHLDALNRFSPDFTGSLFRGENRIFARQEHMDLLLDGLRKAGLPK